MLALEEDGGGGLIIATTHLCVTVYIALLLREAFGIRSMCMSGSGK